MQRLHNLDKWKCLTEGVALNFASAQPRRVRLDVNAPGEVRVSHIDGNGEYTFLALVKGRDVIEFMAQGEFSVIAEGGDLWLHTIDGENMTFSIPDAVILTNIVERRPRNHEQELMNYLMNQNIERRYAQMREDLDREWARREAASKPAAEKPAAAGDGKPAAKEPEPAGTAGGDKQPEPANAGDGGKAKAAKD